MAYVVMFGGAGWPGDGEQPTTDGPHARVLEIIERALAPHLLAAGQLGPDMSAVVMSLLQTAGEAPPVTFQGQLPRDPEEGVLLSAG